MTGTPRSPWTTEQDKELQALIFSASRVETIAQALHRTPVCNDGGALAPPATPGTPLVRFGVGAENQS
jgi:hypothetical protein